MCPLIITRQGPHGKHRFLFSRKLFVGPLPSNGCPSIIESVCFGNVFKQPLPSNGHMRHSINFSYGHSFLTGKYHMSFKMSAETPVGPHGKYLLFLSDLTRGGTRKQISVKLRDTKSNENPFSNPRVVTCR
jgi:hypothetical protein